MPSPNKDWTPETQKNLDLQLENQTLHTELKLKGAMIKMAPDLDPVLQNEFLKSICAFEQATNQPPGVPLSTLFPPDYHFPPPGSLSSEQLCAKLDDIEQILFNNQVQLDFVDNLPDEVIYKHLVEQLLPTETITAPTTSNGFTIINGCSGWCEGCFQKEYCETSEELDAEEAAEAEQ
jgi:hypothetical protein